MKLTHTTGCRVLLMNWLMGMVVFISLGGAQAQSLRDPTLPPVDAGFASNTGAAKPLGVAPGAMAVIVRNGHPFLVVGTRLYAQGQKLGQSRIERISETEVWLREGAVLHKLTQFSGIERRTVTQDGAYPPCPPSTSKAEISAPGCAGVQ